MTKNKNLVTIRHTDVNTYVNLNSYNMHIHKDKHIIPHRIHIETHLPPCKESL